MRDFFEWKKFDITVDWMDRLFLWEIDTEADERWQAVLVVEEWCVRLYTYMYSDENWTDNWEQCDKYFYNFEGWLDVNSLGYVEIEFDNIDNVVNELVKLCQRELTTNVNWHKTDLKFFLERHEKEIFPIEKIYVYYK